MEALRSRRKKVVSRPHQMGPVIVLLFWMTFLASGISQDDKKKDEDEVRKEPPSPFLFDAKFPSTTESTPDNFTARVGKWSVDGSKKAIRIAAEPTVEGRVEFGPEIRESGATVITTAKVEKGDSPITPWMGVGLYGKNGFSLRIAIGAKKMELVRRGEALALKKFDLDLEKPCHLELLVKENGANWDISGRVWQDEDSRPEKPQLNYKAFGDELLFPLAGRPFLLATPFGGKTVYFSEAKVLKGEYEVWMDNWREGNPKDKAKTEEKPPEEEQKDSQK